MKKIISNVTLDEERALYGSHGIKISNVSFDGPADGESAVKECSDIEAEGCFCNLRYPFWHVDVLKIKDTQMTANCRAALWYSRHICVQNSKLHGIKALRECEDILLENCDIISPEFGWFVSDLTMRDCTAESEYFLMRAKNINLRQVTFKGKYSFQYVDGGVIEDCNLSTKDAFWHSKNLTVKNSVVAGEYLGWYSQNLTFINCTITGTQPLCYCKGLKIINCTMAGCDLSFEKSEAHAELAAPPASIKNFYGGTITVPSPCEIINDDPLATGEVKLSKI